MAMVSLLVVLKFILRLWGILSWLVANDLIFPWQSYTRHCNLFIDTYKINSMLFIFSSVAMILVVAHIYSINGWFQNTKFQASLPINPQPIKLQSGDNITSKSNNMNKHLLRTYYMPGSVRLVFFFMLCHLYLCQKSLLVSFIIISILEVPAGMKRFSNIPKLLCQGN